MPAAEVGETSGIAVLLRPLEPPLLGPVVSAFSAILDLVSQVTIRKANSWPLTYLNLQANWLEDFNSL